MMGHKEAAKKAIETWIVANDMFEDYECNAMEAAIRAYLDARGMMMAPRRLMKAIAEGYPVSSASDTYICVGNPDYKLDDGSDVNIVFSVSDDQFRDAE